MKREEIICRMLRDTERPGTSLLIQYLYDSGFFTAPCSTQHHLAKEGGLAEHSLNVLEFAERINESLSASVRKDSLIICSLLHDIGKCGQFGKPGYIPNMLKGRATKANPNPEPVQSAAKPFIANPDLRYIDHEVRSVVVISRFIDLTEDEQQAILWHNGLYGPFKYEIQGKETPLYMILHFADMWASRVIEREEEADE